MDTADVKGKLNPQNSRKYGSGHLHLDGTWNFWWPYVWITPPLGKWTNVCMERDHVRRIYLTWVWPPHSKTTRTITFFVGDPYKTLFTTFTVRGPHPRYNIFQPSNFGIDLWLVGFNPLDMLLKLDHVHQVKVMFLEMKPPTRLCLKVSNDPSFSGFFQTKSDVT